jgi:hypothetical protein
MFKALRNVRPSHLADPSLFPFMDLWLSDEVHSSRDAKTP